MKVPFNMDLGKLPELQNAQTRLHTHTNTYSKSNYSKIPLFQPASHTALDDNLIWISIYIEHIHELTYVLGITHDIILLQVLVNIFACFRKLSGTLLYEFMKC